MTPVSEIIVPKKHVVAEGDLLQVPGLRDLRVGRAFGSGFMAQNRIYQLLDATTGRNAGLVLKVCRPSGAAQHSLAHEARLYRNLTLLADKYGPSIGTLFLHARAVLIQEDRTIVGVIIEKASGLSIDKRVSDPAFHDVRYVLALLADVLTALDVAQRELGALASCLADGAGAGMSITG
ncbi:hypothetical protein MNEG_7509 [Monoraphidium neglectum]|uniref:Protein kinase domain-containing protein n=1 Tax=Monoraphidium neglectum TaxID=145388 RepID=A0A0D2KZ12_9CHLO|nr:hypothetical protein MNEG_7509 [Monoraphidium neglectum]KIZ00454.1 hypothetical protein MNEG_7509 [Monoraphidium neglectum]|eukprot:XP_013899473.1 hypothetical protein MNEG_7509 [Monoraphidium neglectum]